MESEFPPILKIDITGEIIGRIKALLAKDRLKAGSRLPPERDLARILGVGRPALRQADVLQRLEKRQAATRTAEHSWRA